MSEELKQKVRNLLQQRIDANPDGEAYIDDSELALGIKEADIGGGALSLLLRSMELEGDFAWRYDMRKKRTYIVFREGPTR